MHYVIVIEKVEGNLSAYVRTFPAFQRNPINRSE